MVDASECEEFILELEGMKLVVRRNTSGNGAGIGTGVGSTPSVTSETKDSNSPTSMSVDQSQLAPSATNTTAIDVQDTGESAGTTGVEMRSPMVGTFYRRPSPTSPSFVEVGDRVEPGTPLCIIEVMKLFTTIESTVSGSVTNILANDGDTVEYDQLLFIFDPVVS